MPWYDTEYPYRPGGGYQLADWDKNQEVQWGLDDWLNDQWYQYRRDNAIHKWFLANQPPPSVINDTGFYDSTGYHGPIYKHHGLYLYYIVHEECSFGTRTHFHSRSSIDYDLSGACAFQGAGWSEGATIPGCAGSSSLVGHSDWSTSPIFVCPANDYVHPFFVHHGQASGATLNRYRLSLTQVLQQQSAPAGIPDGLLVEPGTGPVVGQPVFLQDYPGHGRSVTPWKDAVAPVGTQPSLAQQQAASKLPGGKRGTYVVPFSLNHPITRLTVAPGSGPVTVPDQVIDPGTPTEPGGGTIVPPGLPPGNPNPDETKEAKPWAQRLASMGFTAINVVTETQDFMEAMHAALPEKYRSKGRNGGDVPPWVILQDIWDNWDHFDADLAVENFVNNQIEDAIYGRFFGAISRTQKKVGVTAGLSRGVKPREPWKLTVPEIHFANGQFGVEFGEWQIGGYD